MPQGTPSVSHYDRVVCLYVKMLNLSPSTCACTPYEQWGH
jgi:hypothetical protein